MKQVNNRLAKIFCIFIYSVIVSLSLGMLLIYKPYIYVDNNKSQVICDKSDAAFDIGPNYVYTLDHKLDDFNDKKARKLCEYNMILDYGDTLKTPSNVNYSLKLKYLKESSWGDTLTMFFATLIFGILCIEMMRRYLFRVFQRADEFGGKFFKTRKTVSSIIIIFSLLLFFLFFKKPAIRIFCARQTAEKVQNYRNTVFTNGVLRFPQEDQQLSLAFNRQVNKCLVKEKYE